MTMIGMPPRSYGGLPPAYTQAAGLEPGTTSPMPGLPDRIVPLDARPSVGPVPIAPMVAKPSVQVVPPIVARVVDKGAEGAGAGIKPNPFLALAKPTEDKPQRANLDDVRGWMIAQGIFDGLAGRQQDMSPWLAELDRRQAGIDANAQSSRDKEEAAKAARLADPKSQESAAKQNSLRPFLKSSGLSDEEISNLSASDLSTFTVKDAIGFASRAKARGFEPSDDAESDASAAEREAARAAGLDVSDSMTQRQVLTYRAQLGQAAQQGRSNEAWRERNQATYDQSIALQGRGVRLREQADIRNEDRANTRNIEKEQRDMEREIAKEDRAKRIAGDEKALTFATDYEKTNRDYLQMAGMSQDIRDLVGEDGSVDTGVLASLRSRFSTYFNGKEVTDVNAAKRMLLEKWSRTQSGAAISENEEDRFARQTGADPYASEADVDAAFKAMERMIARTLRSGATGNPDAARAVADNAGLNDAWLANVKSARGGGSQQQPDNLGTTRGAGPKVDRVVKPKAVEQPAAASNKDQGMGKKRNGKWLRAVETGQRDGKRVVVFFYVDGSQEVVER